MELSNCWKSLLDSRGLVGGGCSGMKTKSVSLRPLTEEEKEKERKFQAGLEEGLKKAKAAESETQAAAWTSLGVHCMKFQKYEEAAKYFGSALKVLEKQKACTALAHDNLGKAYSCQKKHGAAAKEFTKEVEVLKLKHGGEHADTASALASIAAEYMQMKQYEKSESFYRQALAMYSSLYGEQHQTAQRMIKNLDLLKTKP